MIVRLRYYEFKDRRNPTFLIFNFGMTLIEIIDIDNYVILVKIQIMSWITINNLL